KSQPVLAFCDSLLSPIRLSTKILPEKKPTMPLVAVKPPRYAKWTILLLLMLAAFVFVSVKAQKGGWLSAEADMFLVDHLNPDRPFLSKILAPHSHDAGQYQARELSHTFENFDARFINWSVKHKMPHFFSITSFIFLTALSLVHWRYTTKYLRLDPMVALMLIDLFWTEQSILLSDTFIHVAKYDVYFILLLLCWHLITRLAFPRPAASPAAP